MSEQQPLPMFQVPTVQDNQSRLEEENHRLLQVISILLYKAGGQVEVTEDDYNKIMPLILSIQTGPNETYTGYIYRINKKASP